MENKSSKDQVGNMIIVFGPCTKCQVQNSTSTTSTWTWKQVVPTPLRLNESYTKVRLRNINNLEGKI